MKTKSPILLQTKISKPLFLALEEKLKILKITRSRYMRNCLRDGLNKDFIDGMKIHLALLEIAYDNNSEFRAIGTNLNQIAKRLNEHKGVNTGEIENNIIALVEALKVHKGNNAKLRKDLTELSKTRIL